MKGLQMAAAYDFPAEIGYAEILPDTTIYMKLDLNEVKR